MAEKVRRTKNLKSSTKGLIALLAFLGVILVIVIIMFATTRAQELRTGEFYDMLFDGRIKNESLDIANDTLTFDDADTNRSYKVILYAESGYAEVFADYDAAVREAKRLEAEVAERDRAETEAGGETGTDEGTETPDTELPGMTDAEADAAWDAYVTSITGTLARSRLIGSDYTKIADYDYTNAKYGDRYSVSIFDYVYPVAMIAIMIVFIVILFRSMRGGGGVANDFGKSKANVQSSLKVRFADVAGAEEEKEELAEIVDFLKTPGKFAGVGARVPKGVLLVGPPGTGKTLFAKAVAGEANVPFFSISGSDFVEMYVGVGASRVRDLFAQAKKNQPCIIFIDEIDAVGRQRGAGLGGGHDEREQTLNQLLVQMDGFESNEAIIVMAATNRADILDPALMRPGRFDRQIYVQIPDVRGREAIFKVHARNKPMSPEIDYRVLARITSGFTGAEIANLLNEAAILCARANRTQIIMEDIYEAIDKVIMGPQKKSRLVTEVDKRITAYHEGGHAIVAYRLAPNCDPVHEISIIPRGNAAGYTMTRPDNDDNHITYKKLTADIAMTMGGRAAEELVIKDISAGASGDIKAATARARKMVTEWGMSSVGPVYYGGETEVFLGRDYGSSHNYSDKTAAEIDDQIRKFVEEGHQTALRILSENRKYLDTLVRVLIEKETVYAEEFDMIMQGAPADEVMKVIDDRTYRNFGNKKEKKDNVIHLSSSNTHPDDDTDKDNDTGSDAGNNNGASDDPVDDNNNN